MLKAVLDTNLIVSAAISKQGHPNQILRAWRDGLFELVISLPIIEEMEETLSLKRIKKYRFLTDKEVDVLLSEFRNSKSLVRPSVFFDAVKNDSDDNKFIEAAIAGQADYVVSGDRHLKRLGTFQEVKIVAPIEFTKLLRLGFLERRFIKK
jgi:hypothetical protein